MGRKFIDLKHKQVLICEDLRLILLKFKIPHAHYLFVKQNSYTYNLNRFSSLFTQCSHLQICLVHFFLPLLETPDIFLFYPQVTHFSAWKQVIQSFHKSIIYCSVPRPRDLSQICFYVLWFKFGPQGVLDVMLRTLSSLFCLQILQQRSPSLLLTFFSNTQTVSKPIDSAHQHVTCPFSISVYSAITLVQASYVS